MKRTFDLIDRLLDKFQKDDILSVKRNGKWEKFSTKFYAEKTNFLSCALLDLGLKKGDKIAIISNNRPEWNIVEMATSQIGVVSVPIYPTISDDDYFYILKHSEIKILFVSDESLYLRMQKITKDIKFIQEIYSFDHLENAKNYKELIEIGEKIFPERYDFLKNLKNSISENDLVSIIYTSGTTGEPKGVMLSHKNFVSNFMAIHGVLPNEENMKALSFLPLCHAFERIGIYCYQYRGMSIYYAESYIKVPENLREVNADCFTTVPRVLEKIYDKILTTGKDLKGIKKQIFFWAIRLGERYEYEGKNGWWYEKQLEIADKLVFSKWRKALGGNIKMIICGGASLQERLARIFTAAGLPINEGYGLTECSPIISANRKEYPYKKFGTVGRIIKDIQLKIAEDGEILVKGPNVMHGYYKNEILNNEIFDENGWLHTGDIGELLENNILKITDRKKEIFKMSNGKYIAPQVIENKFKESFFIEQIIVVGENKKFIAALISPNLKFLHDWCAKNKIHYRSNEELIKNKKVLKRYVKEVKKINKNLGKTETIKRFSLVPTEWASNTGELSPTQKLKRNVLMEKYKKKIENFF